MAIPIVDIFAGPGGLGEGFSSFMRKKTQPFQVQLSVEKDPNAHRTLLLRSFVRNAAWKRIAPAYAEFAAGDRTLDDQRTLMDKHPRAAAKARQEAICGTLGGDDLSDDRLDQLIRRATGDSDEWVLVGGPPCQAYSLVGRSRRSRARREAPEEFDSDERHFLYEHYLRILATWGPPVFVMENVKGLLSATVGGKRIVDRMIRDLQRPAPDAKHSYRLFSFVSPPRGWTFLGEPTFDPSDFIIRAEDYGIPQNRHRVIILGIRNDLDVVPRTLKRASSSTRLRDVISDLRRIRSRTSARGGNTVSWLNAVQATRKVLQDSDVPDEVRSIAASYLANIDETLSSGGSMVSYAARRPVAAVSAWYRSRKLSGVSNHEARSHMPSDLQRYFFSACFAEYTATQGAPRSPKLADFPEPLLPNHKNVINGTSDVFSDRFRVQLWDKPATTVTSHIAKDGHYFVHPDPAQCRSLTVREAARIQTFPDDYIFLGPRTSQYAQVGNAVPPMLATQLAGVVFDVLRRWKHQAE